MFSHGLRKVRTLKWSIDNLNLFVSLEELIFKIFFALKYNIIIFFRIFFNTSILKRSKHTKKFNYFLIKNRFNCGTKDVIGNMVVVVFQSDFYSEMYQNNIFYF
jgi:DNA segregation ATPase FtsK/SpoIIIE-like protein